MNRRKFLQIGGVGLLTVAGGSLFTNFSGIDRSDFTDEKYGDISLSKELIDIFYHASLAPSGHNTQPWLIKLIDRNRFRISLNNNCLLPAVDPNNRESLLSIGAFTENLVLSANKYGYATELKMLTENPYSEDIMEVKLSGDRAIPFQMQKIINRRTVRNGYSTREIKAEDFAYITNNDTNHFHYFTNESKEGRYMSQGTIEANRIQAFRDDAQEELANWIRWSPEEAKNKRDGLTPESMEIEGFAGWVVRNFYSAQTAKETSFREKTVEKVVEHVNSSGGWIIITSKDKSVKTLVETGRLFERTFLKIRDKNVGIHPMTQLLEESAFNKSIAGELGVNSSEIQFILRTGYLEKFPEPVSLRRPISKIILGNV